MEAWWKWIPRQNRRHALRAEARNHIRGLEPRSFFRTGELELNPPGESPVGVCSRECGRLLVRAPSLRTPRREHAVPNTTRPSAAPSSCGPHRSDTPASTAAARGATRAPSFKTVQVTTPSSNSNSGSARHCSMVCGGAELTNDEVTHNAFWRQWPVPNQPAPVPIDGMKRLDESSWRQFGNLREEGRGDDVLRTMGLAAAWPSSDCL